MACGALLWTGLLRSHCSRGFSAAVQTERILCRSVGSESVLVRVQTGRMLSLCAGEPVPLTLHQDVRGESLRGAGGASARLVSLERGQHIIWTSTFIYIHSARVH